MQQCMEKEHAAAGTHDISTESGRRRFSDDFHSSGTSLSWDAEFFTVTPIIHAENVGDKYDTSPNPKGRSQNPSRGHVTFKDDITSGQQNEERLDDRKQNEGRKRVNNLHRD